MISSNKTLTLFGAAIILLDPAAMQALLFQKALRFFCRLLNIYSVKSILNRCGATPRSIVNVKLSEEKGRKVYEQKTQNGHGRRRASVHRRRSQNGSANGRKIELVCGAFSSNPKKSKLSGKDLFCLLNAFTAPTRKCSQRKTNCRKMNARIVCL